MDQHDLRSLKTRSAMAEALTELTLEKGYHRVTVQDICRKARVNRSTFYRHFEDKDDLLERHMAELFAGLKKLAPEVGSKHLADAQQQDISHLEAFYTFVADHAEFFQEILSERGSFRFRSMLVGYMCYTTEAKLSGSLQEADEPEVPVGLIARSQAEATIGVILWWLEEGRAHSSAQVAALHMRLLSGTMRGLGY